MYLHSQAGNRRTTGYLLALLEELFSVVFSELSLKDTAYLRQGHQEAGAYHSCLLVEEAGYTLDRPPVHHRAKYGKENKPFWSLMVAGDKNVWSSGQFTVLNF